MMTEGLPDTLGAAERRSLLQRVLSNRVADRRVEPPSFAQERLWFFDQFEPGSPAYVLSGRVRLQFGIDRGALRRAFTEIVRRHEALRTTFAAIDGRPVQVIAGDAEVALPVIDLRRVPAPEQAAEIRRLAAEEMQRPFDLLRGPLLRTTLLALGDADHVLLLSIHHIVSDGWSIGVFFRELAALYNAFASGQPSPLPELQVQYADFALWQRESLQGAELERHLAYWRRQLDGAPSVLALPTDRPRPPVQTFNGAAHAFTVPPSVARELTILSRRQGVTPFMTLLAAFATLLNRYTAQDDIVVGSPIANRTRAELEGLIGFFVNTLVLRIDLAGNPTFRELLSRVRETTLEAYAHQDLPFEKLVKDLQPERTLSHNPLFQVVFALQNAPTPGQAAGNSAAPAEDASPEEADQVVVATAKFDLTLFATETPSGLKAFIEYNTDLFDRATIERMAGHFCTLLVGVAADSDCRLGELPLLTADERRRTLVEWNDTGTPYARERCIHELIEDQVERTPEAVAVRSDDGRVTYRELNAGANQLAHHLRELGVRPEVRVGLCLERSPALMTGVLAILKAGGVYVPLDPTYPRDRLELMLADSHASVVLTQGSLAARIRAGAATVVALDSDRERIAAHPDTNVPLLGRPDNLAYVIYTSGSTGVPKGVMVAGSSFVNLLGWYSAQGGHAAESTVALMIPIGFDASLKSMLAPLTCGGSVALSTAEYGDARAQLRFIERHGVASINCTPTFIYPVVERAAEDGYAGLASLRYLALGGEPTSLDTLRSWLRSPGESCTLGNVYGPAECTDVACGFEAPKRAAAALRSFPIGRPVPNVRAYVLDRSLEPVPLGVTGELYVGGIALARGYLDRPDATAERFVPDPHAADPGARMYRTGDLARYLPNGTLEYAGRADRQVKVRGVRVELDEIEAVIRRHPAVHEAAVVARDDVHGFTSLVAYVAGRPGARLSVTSVREFLGSLPEHLIPAAYVFLDAMPVSANGKIDYLDLPAPDSARPVLEQSFVAPATPVEIELARIWSAVLGIDRIGASDNFFELGGHSLIATQVVSRVRDSFRVDVPLRELFENLTIASLARVIETYTERAPDVIEARSRR